MAFAAAARSATPMPTSIHVVQDPAYVYLYDQVTLTATVTPNPGAGVVEFSYGGQIHETVPLGADGTATHVATANQTSNGTMVVHAEFYATAEFAGSFDNFLVDLRFLPNVHIDNPPVPTSSTSASIAFTVGDGVTTQCRLDADSWAGCSSPWTTSGLTEGTHTFEARGTLGDGRYGQPASASWAVDQTPPSGTIELNHGVPSTNHGIVWLDHPATDALSGVKWVRVSRTGEIDSNGNLLLGDNTTFAYQRLWSQLSSPGHEWGVFMRESGPQTVWVQWFDFAGNASPIASTSIDVRVAEPRLGGLWSTATPVVPFSITGIGAAEIKSLRIVNGWHNLEYNLGNATVLASPPTTWNVGSSPTDDGLAGRLRLVVIQWKDAFGQWSDSRSVPIALVDQPMPDILLDEGASVTPDPIVQSRWASTEVLRYFTDSIEVEYSCDGSHWWGGWTTAGYVPIDVTRSAAGCPSGNGQRTISFRWFAECCTYADIRQATIDLQRDFGLPPDDESAPTGTVDLPGGGTTATSTVTLATPAADGASGVSNVRLSNDGVTWTTRAYKSSQSWTLLAGNGTKKVWAQWRDRARNWSRPIFTTIAVDTTKPTVSGVKVGFSTGSTVTAAGSTPMKVTWTGADVGSGIKRYDVAVSTDGRGFVSLGSVTAASVTKSASAGHTYRFRIRPVDKAGNVGSWIESRTVHRTLVSSSIAYAGTWKTSSCASCLAGAQRTSRDAGAKATRTVTGRGVAYIATVGSSYGQVKVYVDGTLAATVNLHASTTSYRRIVWSIRWSSTGTHTIRIKVVSPDGGPRASVDAIAILK